MAWLDGSGTVRGGLDFLGTLLWSRSASVLERFDMTKDTPLGE